MQIDQKTKTVIGLVYDIVMSLMLLVCGIAFSVSCYGIYTSAEKQMFTYRSIGDAFDKIDVLVYITLALIAVGAILSIWLPRDEVKMRGVKSAKTLCTRLGARIDVNTVPDEEKNSILFERRLRRGLRIAFIVVAALEALLPLIFLLNPANFPANNGEYNTEVARGLLVYLAMLAPISVYGVVSFVLTRHSYLREAERLKCAVKAGGAIPPSVDEAAPRGIIGYLQENRKPILLGARIALFGCAVLFIVVGIVNGGMGDVLVKAINICAECIGLG